MPGKVLAALTVPKDDDDVEIFMLGHGYLRPSKVRPLPPSHVSRNELIGNIVQVIADDLRLRANPQNVVADPFDQRCFPAGRNGAERVPCVARDKAELRGFHPKLRST